MQPTLHKLAPAQSIPRRQLLATQSREQAPLPGQTKGLGGEQRPASQTRLTQSSSNLHPCPVGQRLVCPAQGKAPQSTPLSLPFLTPSAQLAFWQIPAVQTPSRQSSLWSHFRPVAQRLPCARQSGPPQSRSVSAPFKTMSPQVGPGSPPAAPAWPAEPADDPPVPPTTPVPPVPPAPPPSPPAPGLPALPAEVVAPPPAVPAVEPPPPAAPAIAPALPPLKSTPPPPPLPAAPLPAKPAFPEAPPDPPTAPPLPALPEPPLPALPPPPPEPPP